MTISNDSALWHLRIELANSIAREQALGSRIETALLIAEDSDDEDLRDWAEMAPDKFLSQRAAEKQVATLRAIRDDFRACYPVDDDYAVVSDVIEGFDAAIRQAEADQ